MNGGGLAGFSNVPVTRSFIICCVFLSILVGIKGYSNELGLSYQGVFKKLHIWKFAVSTFAFSSTPEMMYGVYLLYYFRVFERQIGSNKYSMFMLFSIMVSLLLEILALGLLKDPYWNTLKSGPYGLIFSSFVPFYFDIPVTTRFRVYSLHFSNKSFIYLSGLQLLFSSWKRSILPGICGIVAGSLYRLNIFYIRRMKFPEFMVSFISRISSPSMGSTPRATTITSVIGGIVPPSNGGRQVEGNNMPVATMEPAEESIATLVSMGFDPNSARQALVHARNDISIATNILIESQSH